MLQGSASCKLFPFILSDVLIRAGLYNSFYCFVTQPKRHHDKIATSVDIFQKLYQPFDSVKMTNVVAQ